VPFYREDVALELRRRAMRGRMVGLRPSIDPTLAHVGHYFAVEDDEQWSCMPAH
jgi:hypothetical protein